MLKFNEYFDSEELKDKDEIKFLKGETRDEVKDLSSKQPRDLKYAEKVIRSLTYNNPFIGKFEISMGNLPTNDKDVIVIEKEIDKYDGRFSAISFIKSEIIINKDKTLSISTQCEVKVADTDNELEYKKLHEDLLNQNVKNIDELNEIFKKEVYPFFKKWDKWSYNVTGKSILNGKEIEFKDDMVIDHLKGGDFELKEEPNFNPQFNSKSYKNLKGYNKF